MKKQLKKKWLFSLFAFPLAALPIGLSTIHNSNNSISLVHKSLNVNESTTDSDINLEDALPVADSSITSFGDYIVSYEDNNIYPVNVTIPFLTTDTSQGLKAGGATVGMTTNKQTITLTTYAGLLLWSHKLTENSLLKNYYNSVESVSDISNYKVINFAYLESKSILFVLFGNETTANNTTTLSNLVVFGLDINSGAIVVPKNAKLNDSQVIAKARDDSAFIFFNSSDQLIVTSGDNVADINKSTKIMTFDEADAGFANVANKGNDEETNNFNYDQTKNTQNLSANDMLIGFLPSETSGINYSFWLQSNVQINSNGTELSYSTSNATTGAPNNTINSNNKWLNYYVIPVNDSFENITAPGTINRSTKTGNAYDAKRGYLLPASDNNLPKINDITKRFFSTGLSNNNGTTTETFGVLIDSYDSMFSTFINYSVNITDSNKSITLDQTPSFYFNVNNVNSGPTSDDLVSLPDNVAVNKWEFSSVGYDKESNFVYLSLSGSEINVSENNNDTIIPGKYLTNTRYASLKTADSNVSKDAYVESSPYTLSDVNFDTYTNQENLYLTKQVISGNDGQWLKTTVTDFNDDTKDFEPTTDSKINFYSLENLAKNLENSTILNNVMPSSINSTSLDGYLKENDLSDTVKFNSVEGNDETGEINLETEITYSNNFGDSVDNGSVSYDSYIQAKGFANNDFQLTFKQETESAVKEIREKYSAEKIVATNNKYWVIENLLQNITIKDKPINVTESMITLSNPNNDKQSLKVDINIPIKTSPTDTNGILPVGYPTNKANLTMTYNGFTGTEAPGFVPNPNNPNPDEGLSGGAIAGIVIGCLALAAILIAAIVLIRIRTKKTNI